MLVKFQGDSETNVHSPMKDECDNKEGHVEGRNMLNVHMDVAEDETQEIERSQPSTRSASPLRLGLGRNRAARDQFAAATTVSAQVSPPSPAVLNHSMKQSSDH